MMFRALALASATGAAAASSSSSDGVLRQVVIGQDGLPVLPGLEQQLMHNEHQHQQQHAQRHNPYTDVSLMQTRARQKAQANAKAHMGVNECKQWNCKAEHDVWKVELAEDSSMEMLFQFHAETYPDFKQLKIPALIAFWIRVVAQRKYEDFMKAFNDPALVDQQIR